MKKLKQTYVDFIKVIKFVYPFLLQHNKMYVFSVYIATLVGVIIPFINIYGVRFIIEEISSTQNIENIWRIVIAIFVANMVFKSIKLILDRYNSIAYMKNLDIFTLENCKKFMNMDFECLENPEKLTTMQKMHEVEQMFGGVLEKSAVIFASLISLLFTSFIITTLNPILLMVIISGIMVSAIANKKAKEKLNEISLESAKTSRLHKYLHSITTEVETGKEIRLNALQKYFKGKISNALSELLFFENQKEKATMKASSIRDFINIFQLGVLYAFMTSLFLAGKLTIGMFSFYIGCTNNFSDNLKAFLVNILEITANTRLIDKYNDFHSMPETLRETKKLPLPKGEVVLKFNNVYFKYPNTENYILENINFEMKHTETISLIGKNGAGKSTLIKLICRLYDPTKGEITINNINIKNYDYDDYMMFVSTVFQDFKLFALTIRENLDLRMVKSDSEIFEALEKSDVLDKVNATALKLDSRLFKGKGWEDSIELSGGEYQKLAIARAHLKDSSIVIMDEPTSALDPVAEFNVFRILNDVKGDKNAIFVSHRLSSVKFSDRIIFLDDKKRIHFGDFNNMMKNNSDFNEMYKKQAIFYV